MLVMVFPSAFTTIFIRINKKKVCNKQGEIRGNLHGLLGKNTQITAAIAVEN